MFSLNGDALAYQIEHIPVDQAESVKQILVAGDLCLQGRPEILLLNERSEELWGDITSVTGRHDLNVVNLECPLTDSRTPIVKVGPHLRADPRCASGIRAAGFDVATLANNHILDMGEAGLQDTLSACHLAGLQTVGASCNLSEATRVQIITIQGFKVAILAFAEHEFSIATRTKAGAWPLDLIDNYYQLAEARRQADFVLVVLHGGNEGFPLPSPRLVKTCRYFADVGASAVICHHSHISSGIEVIHGVPIIYGTGNFLFDGLEPHPATWYVGYMVSLRVHHNRVAEVILIPYIQSRDKPGIQLMQGKEATLFLTEILRLSQVIQDQTTFRQAWQDFCRERQTEYFARLVASNGLEERLWSRGLLPLKLIQRRIPNWLGLIACEAHQEVLIEILQHSLIDIKG